MSAVIAPPRTDDQRLAALRHANEIRAARAGLKRELKVGRQDVVEILRDPPAFIRSMKVYDLLRAQRGWRDVRVTRTLNRLRVSHSKTVAGLSPRQRDELIAEIGATS